MLALLVWMSAAQAPDLLHRVVPRPTGANGYEEYLQAADVLASDEAKAFARWTPGASPPTPPPVPPGTGLQATETPRAVVDLYARLNALSPLDARREELRRFGRALDLVARGNGKRVVDPRSEIGPETPFPEFAGFRQVARFAARAAVVHAADGATNRATDVLLDGLTFADNFGRGTLIANLVGTAGAGLALGAFNDLLPHLSRADALRIARTVDGLLARPTAARTVMPAEAALTLAGVRLGFTTPGGLKDLFTPLGVERLDPQAERWQREADALPSAAREPLLRALAGRLTRRVQAADRVFAGPERDWHAGIADLEGSDMDRATDLADALLAAVSPAYGSFADAVVLRRTQLRLLALHARLIVYRWDWGRYPERMEETDPLTGRPYLYEIRPDGTVRLASEGTPELGEIELRYTRPVRGEEKGGGATPLLWMRPFAPPARQGTNPYAKLGATIPKAEWEHVLADAAKPPAGRTPLAVQQAAAERWGRVLTEFRKLSEAALIASATDAERADVERLARLAALAARVRFADGDRAAATTLLLDVLALGRRTRSATVERMALTAFANHLNDLSLAQCERARDAVEAYLSDASWVAPDEPVRLRLLRLHMRIEAYRWRQFKLPTTLAEAAPAPEVLDPATGKAFRYEASGTTYRLRSERFGPLEGRD